VILAISHAADLHATEVLRRLAATGASAVLFDTAQIPREARVVLEPAVLTGWTASVNTNGANLDLNAVRSVWWRRPQPFTFDPAMSNRDDLNFAHAETHAALMGLWSCLDATWLNDPDRDQRAGRKAWQLKVATDVGLRVPRTCVTNDPARARAFVEQEGERGTIYKAFSGTERTWRETRILRQGEGALLGSVRFAPVIFQEYIAAAFDLRITIVGSAIFAAAIHSQATSYPVDFRMAMHEAVVEAHALPDAVSQGLLRLMARLGLVYGAIDMRLTPDGEYVFLEVNPAGQWLFVEQRTGQPIAQAVADQLRAWDQ
jgi:MvdD pre-ATP grasp domain/RimK-like ATP-grasp domain